MAEAWAQLTGQPGVALVTAGAGLGNAVGALISARASDTPLLLLSGDSPLAQDGRGAFQELDQCAITAPVTKHSERVATAAGMALTAHAALHLAASGRPGPVHLALPADLLTATVEAPPHVPDADTPAPLPGIADLRDGLATADRALILLGPSLSETRCPGLAHRLSSATGAAVLCMESPRGLKDPAIGGLGHILSRADHVLSLGKQVDFTTGFGTGDARWDVVLGEAALLDMARRNLGTRLGIARHDAPRIVAEALCQGAVLPENDWRREVARHSAAGPTQASGELSSATLVAALAQARAEAPEGIVTLIDGGEIGQWAQAALRGAPRIINGPSGAIGGILPAAIAAAHACPGQRILAVMGDGTAGFHLAELETLARENLSVTLVIGNDRRWNAEHRIQVQDYGAERTFGCDLSAARYADAALALGIGGQTVDNPADMGPALRRALQAGGPFLLDVLIDGLPAPIFQHPNTH
jgi:acetolactate synthase-1/2/3 large subunit